MIERKDWVCMVCRMKGIDGVEGKCVNGPTEAATILKLKFAFSSREY